MKWIIFASAVFVTISLAPAYAQPPMAPPPPGTCASIGYSDKCCPQSSNRDTCRASDGNCNCGYDCHFSHNNDCCSDIDCPRNPTMCAHVGIYGCCNITSPGDCEVRNGQDLCFCDTSCHTRGDCCPDACALTCGFHRKAIGCCQWSTNPPWSCYVNVGDCYCDSYCAVFGDCCSDVLPHCNSDRVTSQSWRSQQTRLQSVLEQELTAKQVQDYYSNRGRRVNTASDNVDRDYIHHRMALAARTQRVRGNTARYNEFQRGRARVAARPPGPPPYNYNY